MTVREALELLARAGIRAIVADDAGDRYGAAGWIMDRTVARIVVVPELEAAGVPPAGLAAAVDEIESRLVGLDDDDGPRPFELRGQTMPADLEHDDDEL